MANPTVSASLDKAAYAEGETMVLTVNRSDADTEALTLTIVATDKSGNSSTPVNVTATIDPTTVSVSDSSGRVWAQQSDNGSIAVFTAVA